MPHLTPEGLRAVSDIAGRHGVSADAALSLLESLAQGNGYQAQFNHPDLGGMGQWSQGGMIMIGDMLNQGLKFRVDGLCNELAGLLRSQPSIQSAPAHFQSQTQGGGVSLFAQGSSSAHWWPSELGSPASAGAQNDMRYAFFPASRRLAIQQNGGVRVYDTADHQLSGFSQQQGADQALTFTSQHGLVRVADLPVVGGEAQSEAPTVSSPAQRIKSPAPPIEAPLVVAAPPSGFSPASSAPVAVPRAIDDVVKIIESLAGLRQKGLLTEEEFASKKAELLSRL